MTLARGTCAIKNGKGGQFPQSADLPNKKSVSALRSDRRYVTLRLSGHAFYAIHTFFFPCAPCRHVNGPPSACTVTPEKSCLGIDPPIKCTCHDGCPSIGYCVNLNTVQQQVDVKGAKEGHLSLISAISLSKKLLVINMKGVVVAHFVGFELLILSCTGG